MTDSQFSDLVSRLETVARKTPVRYRIRVLLLALLGNGYVATILVSLGAAMVFLGIAITTAKFVAFKLMIFIAPVFWVTLKSFWIKLDPPDGIEIKPQQAPELFLVIDAVRQQLDAPRCYRVLISDEINAGVSQIPRFGLFGWYQSNLVIGLPLMQALTVAQFRAVLAHEFGHLAGRHTHFSRWIYNQRQRWGKLLVGLAQHDGRGSFLFRPFLTWYIPYFNAYSFPLARANEYEADAVSAKLTSVLDTAEALTGIRAVSHFLHETYWPRIHDQVETVAQPGFMPYSGFATQLGCDLDQTTAQEWIDRDMAEVTGTVDTHPALADRLAAIGAQPRLRLPATGESAEQLLGSALPGLAQRFDHNWQRRVQTAWEERHQEIQANRQTLATLNTRHNAGETLSLQEAYDRALLTELIDKDADETLSQLEALRDLAPDDAMLMLALGARLLDRDEEQGSLLINQAIHTNANVSARGCEILRDHCWRKGRKEEAHGWHAKALEHAAIETESNDERNRVYVVDTFEHHDLPATTLQEIRQALSTIVGLERAYLVRKKMRHFQDRPCYVLGYSVTRFFQLHSKSRAQDVLKRIRETILFPGETLILSINGDNHRFGRKFRKVLNSELV